MPKVELYFMRFRLHAAYLKNATKNYHAGTYIIHFEQNKRNLVIRIIHNCYFGKIFGIL